MNKLILGLLALSLLLSAQACNGTAEPEPDPGGTSQCDAAEVCDGLDNDCDGLVDEGVSTQACGSNEGVCRLGVQYCNGVDGYGPCQVDVSPDYVEEETWEQCDGLDNDCDGYVDEGVEREATRFDDDGDGFRVTPTLDPELCPLADIWRPDPSPADCDDTDPAIHPGAEEICDGVDNDCDGQVDELIAPVPCDAVGVQEGLCRGRTRCVDGEVVCDYLSGPEVCLDGLDNDCDGEVDEGCSCDASDEVCDGLDNDCDGQVDETCLYPSDAVAELSPAIEAYIDAPWEGTTRMLAYIIRTPHDHSGYSPSADEFPDVALRVRLAPRPIAGWIGDDAGDEITSFGVWRQRAIAEPDQPYISPTYNEHWVNNVSYDSTGGVTVHSGYNYCSYYGFYDGYCNLSILMKSSKYNEIDFNAVDPLLLAVNIYEEACDFSQSDHQGFPCNIGTRIITLPKSSLGDLSHTVDYHGASARMFFTHDMTGDGSVDYVLASADRWSYTTYSSVRLISGRTGHVVWSREQADDIYCVDCFSSGGSMFIDITGDGVTDVVLSDCCGYADDMNQESYTYITTFDGPGSSDISLDRICSGLCDANADGIPDLVCYARNDDYDAPSCVIFGGSDLSAESPCEDVTGLDLTPLSWLPPPLPMAPVNHATLYYPGSTDVSDVGDLTGDGYVDQVVSYPGGQRLIHSGAPR